MKLQFKHQAFQAEAAAAVCDVFAGQPLRTAAYRMDPGMAREEQINALENTTEIGFANHPLVPELTAKAARQASLGAGAKVIKTYSYELTEGDLQEIDQINPDICLLTGGTDGGNKENIVFNAQMLAKAKHDFPIIIAGNRNCADKCQEILKDKQTYVCENVMPRLDIPNVEPVQKKIREIFLEQIVKAKGLSRAQQLVQGILMPTPSAMLTAMKLLAKGCEGEDGIGDLVGVDLGGATTDIYSMSFGLPTTGMTALKGLREEYAKRTVEGDIGMRYSIHGIVDATVHGIIRGDVSAVLDTGNISLDPESNRLPASTEEANRRRANMNKNKQRVIAFLLAWILMGTLIVPVLAVESGEVHIQTAQDLATFSRNCSVDGWSVGKTVYLDKISI